MALEVKKAARAFAELRRMNAAVLAMRATIASVDAEIEALLSDFAALNIDERKAVPRVDVSANSADLKLLLKEDYSPSKPS